MKALLAKGSTNALVLLMAIVLIAAVQSPGNAQQEQARPNFEGEYSGQLLVEGEEESVDVGLEVRATGGSEYRAVLYYGGLPGERSEPASDEDTVELEGTYEDFTLRLEDDIPLRFQYIHGRFTALDEDNSYRGHLDRVVRVRPDS